MPTLDEEMQSLGFSPEGGLDSQMDELGFEPIAKPNIAQDTYQRIGGGLVTGGLDAASGVARWTAGLFKAQEAGANALGAETFGEVSGAISKEFTGLANTLSETSAKAQADSEALRDRSRDANFTAQLAEAGGSFAGQISTAALGRVPAIVSNVGQMFQQEYKAAKEKGADDLTAYTAGVANLPAAFLDYLAERNIVGGVVKKGAAAIATRIATTFGIEGGTEVLQDEYSNWLAGNALKYDQSRAVEERFSAENLPETGKAIATTFAIGGILGGGTTALIEAARPASEQPPGIAPQLEDLQKELDAIQAAPDESFNETQKQAETTPTITPTEPRPDVQPAISEATGDTPTEALPEVSRVRAAADPVFAEHVTNVERLTGQERLDYIATNGLDPVDFGIEEAVTSPEIAPEETAPVSEQVVTPSASEQPISQPEAITGALVTPKLKAKVGVLDRAAKTITGDWTNAPEVVVVPNVSEIPENALSSQDREAMKGNIDGLFGRDGKVYLVGSSVNSVQRAKEIILHETKGHFGLKGLFGDDISSYDKAMKAAWTEFQARPALLNQIVQRGKFNSFQDLKNVYSHLDLATPEGRSAMAEELMARAAEIYLDPSKPRPTWFNSLISKIKVALQKVMPSMKLTDEDIVGLLSTHQKKLLDRASESVEGMPAASMTEVVPVPPLSMTEGTGAFQGLEAALFSMSGTKENVKEAAIKYFGLTNNIYEAGYILDDGRMLDLSGRHYASGYKDGKPVKGQPDYLKGSRAVDHRELGEDIPLEKSGTDKMTEFMHKTNSMRFHNLGDQIAANTVGMPTAAQLNILNRESKNAEGMQIDVDSPDGDTVHGEYIENPNPSKIKKFYEEAKKSYDDRIKTLSDRGVKFSVTGHAPTDQILNDLNSKSEKAYTELFDDFNALAVVEKGLNLGKRFDATMSAWTAALQTRQLANVMKTIFRDGMTAYNSKSGIFERAKDSKGLQAIFEPLTSQGLMDTWENYAKGKRAQTLVKQKLGVPWSAASEAEVKKLTGFTKTEANQWIQEGSPNPTVVQSHADYQKHNEQLRDFALQTGLISQQQKAAMDQLLDYVPFFREMDEEGNVRERGKSGLSGQTSGIKEFKGSEKKILPLLESIAGQTSRIVDAGMKNIAAQRAVGVMQAAGVAERVPLATQPVSKNLATITQDLSKLGVYFNRLPQSAKDHLTGLLYGPQKQTGSVTSDPNVVSVKVNGKNQYYKTSDRTLASALESITKPEENFLMRVLAYGKQIQTVTATTNPGFAVANLARDTLSTFVQTGDSKYLFRVAKGLVKAATNAPELQAIQATGSGGSAFLNIDPKNIRDVLKSDNYWKNRWQDKFFMKSVWNGWKQVLHAAENANRVAIYDKVIEKGGTPAEAAFQAQDTLNFQMHGASRSLQMISAAVPFLNARMQGAYKIGRSFNEDPKGVALRGGMLMLGSLGLWALNHLDREDEDENGKNWYERLSNNDKALYWHMRVPGSSTIIRIPKPFEMGTMFATFPELVADTISDPKEARRSAQIAGTSTAQAIPVLGDAVAAYLNSQEKSTGGKVGEALTRAAFLGNPLIRTPLELYMNKNMFFNAPIITNKNAPAQAQFSDRTSATARAVGDVTGGSPQQIDYAINSFLSGLTPYVLAVSDVVAKSAGYEGTPAKNAEDYIGAGRFVKDSKTMSNRYSQEFYQLRSEAEDALASVKWTAINVAAAEAKENDKDKRALLGIKKTINSAEKELKAYRDELSRVRNGDGTKEEKRKKEDEIAIKRNSVFSRTMKYYQNILDQQKPSE